MLRVLRASLSAPKNAENIRADENMRARLPLRISIPRKASQTQRDLAHLRRIAPFITCSRLNYSVDGRIAAPRGAARRARVRRVRKQTFAVEDFSSALAKRRRATRNFFVSTNARSFTWARFDDAFGGRQRRVCDSPPLPPPPRSLARAQSAIRKRLCLRGLISTNLYSDVEG